MAKSFSGLRAATEATVQGMCYRYLSDLVCEALTCSELWLQMDGMDQGGNTGKCQHDLFKSIPNTMVFFYSCSCVFSTGSECSGAAAHFNLRNFKPRHLFKDLFFLVSLVGLISISSAEIDLRINFVAQAL